MAFKMRHKLTSVGLKNKKISTSPLTQQNPNLSTNEGYEEINRTTTERRGEKDGVPGTYFDTVITERLDEEFDVPNVVPAKNKTKLPDDEYIKALKRKYPNITGREAVERGFIKPKFMDQFPVYTDQRDRTETTFTPDPTEKDKNYQRYNYRVSYAPNTFGANQAEGKTFDRDEAFQAYSNVKNTDFGEGYLYGIINRDDYDKGQRYGLGYAQDDFRNTRDALRQKYNPRVTGIGLNNNPEYQQELLNAQNLFQQRRNLIKQKQFYSDEARKRYEDSFDVIIDRKFNKGDFFDGSRTRSGEDSVIQQENSEALRNYADRKGLKGKYYRF